MTPLLLVPDRAQPGDEALRRALYLWAFRNQPDPPQEVASVLAWVAGHSLPLPALADDDIALDVLAAIARKLDGGRAAANTIARKRAVLSNVLDYAVGCGLDSNPLPRVAGMWTSPKTTEGVVDPQVVVNRRQAEELLIAVSYQSRIGPRLVAFFACLYFAGLHPGEAVNFARTAASTSPMTMDGERSTYANQRRRSEPRGQRQAAAAIPGSSSIAPRTKSGPSRATRRSPGTFTGISGSSALPLMAVSSAANAAATCPKASTAGPGTAPASSRSPRRSRTRHLPGARTTCATPACPPG